MEVNLGMWVMVLFYWFPQSLVVSPDPESGDQNPQCDSFLLCFPSPLSSHTPNSALDTLHTSHVPHISPSTPLRHGCCCNPSAWCDFILNPNLCPFIYLFMRHTERGRDTGKGRSRLMQGAQRGTRSQTKDYTLSQRQMLNH